MQWAAWMGSCVGPMLEQPIPAELHSEEWTGVGAVLELLPVGSVGGGWCPVGGTPGYRLEHGKSMRKEWERLSVTDPCSPAPLRKVRSKK